VIRLRRKPPRPARRHPDLKTNLTRSHLRLQIDGRWVTASAEAFLTGHGSPDFVVIRDQIEWDDRGAIDDQDRSRIVNTILASAAERGLRIEVE
jgi:hypothetical protein